MKIVCRFVKEEEEEEKEEEEEEKEEEEEEKEEGMLRGTNTLTRDKRLHDVN